MKKAIDMKTKIYARLAALATVAAMAAGCSDKGDGFDPVSDPVEFSAGIATRTAAGGDQWLTTDEIGIFMTTSGSALGANMVPEVNNTKYRPDTDGASANLVPLGTTIYWPQTTGSYDFIAYYPWKAVGAGDIDPAAYTYPVNVDDQSDPAALDILYAKTTGKVKGQAVPFSFGHVMSKVRVNITAADDISDTDLAGITATIEGVPITAALELDDGTLLVSPTPAGMEMRAITAGAGFKASFEAIIIPLDANDFLNRSISFVFDNIEPRKWDIPDDNAMPAGKVRTYNLKVGRDGIKVVTNDIEDWTGKDATPDDQEIKPAGIHNAGDLEAFSGEWNATGGISNLAERAAAQDKIITNWSRTGKADGPVTVWADIDMSSVMNFTPIGNRDNPFTGTFDGNGRNISNLTLTGTNNIGLFGANSGTVRGIILKDCNVTATYYVGGIVGWNNGTITNCEIAGGTLKATMYIGGISGCNNGSNSKIKNCTVSGDPVIAATMQTAGGIVGLNSSGTVTVCGMNGGTVKATQSQAGGIAGWNATGTITDCWISGGTVTADNQYAGGIAGNNQGAFFTNSPTMLAYIENCTVSGDPQIKAKERAGGIAGYNYGGDISQCRVSGGTVTAETQYAGGIAGYNYNESRITNCGVSGGKIEAVASNSAGGIAGTNQFASMDPGFTLIENCTVSGSVDIKAPSRASGIVGTNASVIAGCMINGGSVTGTKNDSGGIVGVNTVSGVVTSCISAPSFLNNVTNTGVVVGNNNNGGSVDECHWAEGVLSGNPAVGNSNPANGGSSFDPNSVQTYFTQSVIDTMNDALEASGSDFRWQVGASNSGWWPKAYIP